MIPRDYITEWRGRAPWADNAQVEQDLAICRALVNIFSHPVLSGALAFRGGTALYKLYLTPAARYSEDIDLVQVRAEPAGAVMDALREMLDPWLGKPQWKQTEGRVTFNYRFSSEDPTPLPLRLKVEVNSREHCTAHGFRRVPFAVASRWFNGISDITTYDLDELLGTKLRALYQRRKGRDLFDMATALTQGGVDPPLHGRGGRAPRHAGGVRGQPRGEARRQAFPVGHPAVARRRPAVGPGPSRRTRRGTAVPTALIEKPQPFDRSGSASAPVARYALVAGLAANAVSIPGAARPDGASQSGKSSRTSAVGRSSRARYSPLIQKQSCLGPRLPAISRHW